MKMRRLLLVNSSQPFLSFLVSFSNVLLTAQWCVSHTGSSLFSFFFFWKDSLSLSPSGLVVYASTDSSFFLLPFLFIHLGATFFFFFAG